MKKIISFLLSIALVVGMMAGFGIMPVKAKTIDPPPYSLYATPTMKSVKLKWEKSNNVKKIIVYRADITKKYKKDPFVKLKKKSFKKIATFYGKTVKMTDKAVKKKRYYAYYIKAVLKKKWDGKKTYSTFDKKWYTKAYVGLEKPSVYAGGTDNYPITEKQIYIRCDYGVGAEPKKFIIYRKGPNDKKYKKIKLKEGRDEDENRFFYCDKNVEANKAYKYKVRAYYKKGKKKYYSKYSSPATVVAQSEVETE